MAWDRHWVALGSLALVSSFGCSTDPVAGKDPSAAPLDCTVQQPGAAPAKLLTRTQYNNTVRDLLGTTATPADAFPIPATVEGFENNANLNLANPLLVSQFQTTAEELAGAAISEGGLDRYLGCTLESGDRACADAFIDQFGLAAYRRPLLAAEKESLLRLFDRSAGQNDFKTSIRYVTEAILQAPQFLYRIDVMAAPTTDTGAVPIGPWQMASRLSYLLWNSMPDEELFAAAAADALSDPAEVEAQALRMMEDPRVRPVVLDFHRQWLGFDDFGTIARDTGEFVSLEAQLPGDWHESLDAFIDHVYWEGGGTVQALFTSPTVFVDSDLAQLYGVAAPEGGLAPVEMPEGERFGLLTQPGLMALLSLPSQSSPIRRGVFIRERLLCDPLPPPPPDVDTTPPKPDPNLTTRERFAEHTTLDQCSICHSRIDSIGFGLENYDQLGRFRAEENGSPIDVTGEIQSPPDPSLGGAFNGPVELSALLANSPRVTDCVATQWYRYAMGRMEAEADACSLDQAKTRFRDSGGQFRELILGLTQTDAFLYRPAQDP